MLTYAAKMQLARPFTDPLDIWNAKQSVLEFSINDSVSVFEGILWYHGEIVSLGSEKFRLSTDTGYTEKIIVFFDYSEVKEIKLR